MLTLRPYQEAAKAAVYWHLRTRDDNPCVVMPTASGKTPLLASICRDAVTLWNGRVLILAHVKELLEQAVEKLRAVCPDLDSGVHSAGLNSRDTAQAIIVAGIQSVYKRAEDLGAFDLIIVDECHLLPPEGEGMYRQFLADAETVNPHVRIIGLTATPFRMKSGLICSPEGLLNHVCYEIGVRELIHDGYLSPLVTKAAMHDVDTSDLHVRAGEFVPGEVEDLVNTQEVVELACQEIVEATRDRRSVLIFTAGVGHGRHVARVLEEEHGVECGFVCGETPSHERNGTLDLFRQGDLKFLANVNVLTTGFDAPNIDCVAMLRPTMSPGLYCQMVGRGFRLHPGKENCLILDFAGNVLRHGPVDQVRITPCDRRSTGMPPAKMCPDCRSIVAAGFARCPECDYQFPPPNRELHDGTASREGVLSGQTTDIGYDVLDVVYNVHTKRNASDDALRTMRVDYQIGLADWQSEWVCFEHPGYARQRAEEWWQRRSPDPVPETAERAVELAESGALAGTQIIMVRSTAGEKYDRIVDYELGPLPEEIGHRELIDLDEVPF